eukprot:15050382-Alexandrium_andersonii.AAC.1
MRDLEPGHRVPPDTARALRLLRRAPNVGRGDHRLRGGRIRRGNPEDRKRRLLAAVSRPGLALPVRGSRARGTARWR